MLSLEALVDRFGKNAINVGRIENTSATWIMNSKNRSPNYLSNWNELPLIN
jgi:hypothetical protein